MLKKLYDKSAIGFAVTWIAAYCILMSIGDAVSAAIGLEKSVTLPVGLVLSAVLFCFLKKYSLLSAYGLCRSGASVGEMLYYAPLILLLTANLWFGVRLNYDVAETVLYVLSMFCVGFLEEVIFRGLLFNAMRKEGFKLAVLVSSLTFGMGHIMNLVNGSGGDWFANLMQVIYATAAGFLFVMIYCKSDSLLLCILFHGLFNGLSAFAVDAESVTMQILSCVMLTVISGGYGLYIALNMRKNT